MTRSEYDAQRMATTRLISESRELHAWCRNTRNVCVVRRWLKIRRAEHEARMDAEKRAAA
jgi:hypothetical protein